MGTGNRKIRVGRVVQDKMDKTVIVAIERMTMHPLYRKTVRRVTRFAAHDESNECKIGDTVKIVETRPLSKTKRWRVTEIMNRREEPSVLLASAAVGVENTEDAQPETEAEE